MNLTKNAEKLATLLYQLADWVKSPRFLALLDRTDYSRFARCEKLIGMLRKDLLFQAYKSSRLNDPYSDASAMMTNVAVEFEGFADLICSTFEVNVSEADRSFGVYHDEDFISASYRAFHSEIMSHFCVSAAQLTKQFPCLAEAGISFNARNMMDSLGVWIESINTLANRSDVDWFESMLDELMKHPLFFERGYPHDILAHDKRSVLGGGAPHGIWVREDYASSCIVRNAVDPIPEGFIEYRPS